MKWRYQLIRNGNDLSVHEVYLEGGDKVVAWTENPTTFGGDTVEDVVWSLESALKDIQNFPTLDLPDEDDSGD